VAPWSPFTFSLSRQFHFAAPPEEVWAVLERFDSYPGWCNWLREFAAEGPGLADGTVLRGVVTPPLPYRMRLQVHIVTARRPSLVLADVAGDLRGTARLVLAADGDGSVATLRWRVDLVQRPMRAAALVARPLLAWGHDRVVDATVAGFRRVLG
jgi:carbon monoxide dehydrogenase subunit G